MHDTFNVILCTSADICVIVHDDLGECLVLPSADPGRCRSRIIFRPPKCRILSVKTVIGLL